MQTSNVYYSTQPERVIVTAHGEAATIEFPIDVREVETEAGTQFLAEKVYSLKTRNTENLLERVKVNYDAWLEMAKVVEPPQTTVDDLVEAINTLTDMVIGGMA